MCSEVAGTHSVHLLGTIHISDDHNLDIYNYDNVKLISAPVIFLILPVHLFIFAPYTKMAECILWVCEPQLSVFTHFSAIVVTFHD
jgi:hypothetical protein